MKTNRIIWNENMTNRCLPINTLYSSMNTSNKPIFTQKNAQENPPQLNTELPQLLIVTNNYQPQTLFTEKNTYSDIGTVSNDSKSAIEPELGFTFLEDIEATTENDLHPESEIDPFFKVTEDYPPESPPNEECPNFEDEDFFVENISSDNELSQQSNDMEDYHPEPPHKEEPPYSKDEDFFNEDTTIQNEVALNNELSQQSHDIEDYHPEPPHKEESHYSEDEDSFCEDTTIQNEVAPQCDLSQSSDKDNYTSESPCDEKCQCINCTTIEVETDLGNATDEPDKELTEISQNNALYRASNILEVLTLTDNTLITEDMLSPMPDSLAPGCGSGGSGQVIECQVLS